MKKSKFDPKANITMLVREYINMFGSEFAAFKMSVSEKRSAQSNKFAETQGMDFVVRALYEVPETLRVIFDQSLEPSDLVWLQSKEGGRWFAKNFPDFALSEKI